MKPLALQAGCLWHHKQQNKYEKNNCANDKPLKTVIQLNKKVCLNIKSFHRSKFLIKESSKKCIKQQNFFRKIFLMYVGSQTVHALLHNDDLKKKIYKNKHTQ